MKKWILFVGILLSLGLSIYNNHPHNQVETIVLMRHGEKPSPGLGQLNCQGLNRALALPKLLSAKFGKPDFIFAPNPYAKMQEHDGIYYYVRALATIEPAAIQFAMPVNTQYAYFEFNTVAKELLAPQYHNSLLFVAWEHVNIVMIADWIMDTLGGDSGIIPMWPGDDFDSLYVITINWSRSPVEVSFIHDYEGLNHQSKDCPVSRVAISNFATDTKTFVLIPEAEAVAGQFDQLSCQGLNRSLALPARLKNRYPQIDYFIIPPDSNQSINTVKHAANYLRAFMTIEPTVINYEFNVSIPENTDTLSVVAYLNKLAFANKTLAIAWPINDLANLAQAIYKSNGGNPNDIPNPAKDNDTIYQIKIYHGIPSFTMIQEQLNNRSSICP